MIPGRMTSLRSRGKGGPMILGIAFLAGLATGILAAEIYLRS